MCMLCSMFLHLKILTPEASSKPKHRPRQLADMTTHRTLSQPRALIHLEALLLPDCPRYCHETLTSAILQYIQASFETLSLDDEFYSFDDDYLETHISKLTVSDLVGNDSEDIVSVSNCQIEVHIYKLHTLAGTGVLRLEGEDKPTPVFRAVDLPAESLAGLWDGLVYEGNIKGRLLAFMMTALRFSGREKEMRTMSFNRLVLLHGPPGTGKTSLARSLAHKVAVRLSKQYQRIQLFEINSHSLFSKYFSESAKRLGQVFDHFVKQLADQELFLVILIDEIETLAVSRNANGSGAEPKDAMRVVNVLLTSLDKLKAKENVIVFTTSNLIQHTDSAFLDRCDIKQFIDTPCIPAAYSILRNCLDDMIQAGIITPTEEALPCATEASLYLHALPDAPQTKLWRIATKCAGLSARTLGKLPFLMHAAYVQRENCTMGEALEALEKTVGDVLEDRKGNSDTRHPVLD